MSSKCIICLDVKFDYNLKRIDQKNSSSSFENIFEMLIFSVPQIKPFLNKTQSVCFPCSYQLCDCVSFIQKCIRSAETLIKDDNTIQNKEEPLFTESIMVPVDCIKIEENSLDILLSDVKENCENELKVQTGETSTAIEVQENFECKVEEEIEEKSLDSFPVESQSSYTNGKWEQDNSNTSDTNDSLSEEGGIQSDIHNCEIECSQEKCKLITDGCTFSCSKCTTKFDSNAELKTHRKDCTQLGLSRTNRKPKNIIHNCAIECAKETCAICKNSLCILAYHICRFVCTKCNSKFDSEHKLQAHINDNLDEIECRIGCEYCPLVIAVSELESHQNQHPQFGCDICGKKFLLKTSLNHHQRIHSEKIFKCPECPSTYKANRMMLYHFKCHHSGTDYKVLCDECPRRFQHNTALKRHKLQFHQKVAQSLFLCSKCGMTFTCRESVDQHERLIHQNLKPYTCTLCGKGFGRKDYLERHNKTCYKIRSGTYKRKGKRDRYINFKSNEPVECVYCKKVLRTLHSLHLHIQSTHIKLQLPRPYKCDICPLRFHAKSSLKNHVERHRNIDGKFRCDICYKKFKNVEEVEEHVSERHTKKSYECDLCDEKFARKFLLDNHRQDVHNPNQIFDKSVDELIKAAIDHLEKVGNSKTYIKNKK